MSRWLSLLVAVGLVVGCSTSEEKVLSPTERQRQILSPAGKTFLLKAQHAYENDIYNAALAFADSAERHAPELADIDFLRAKVYTQLKQLEYANQLYKKVLARDSTYQGAWQNIGVNKMRQGDVRDALAMFEKEKERHPTSGVWLEIGRAYAKLGVADSARSAYEQAIALDSSNATAYMWLGQLLEEMGEMEEAIRFSRKGLRLKPDNLNYRYIIGSQLSRLQQDDEALTYLRPVAEKWPWHHGAQYNLGQVLMRLGEEKEAEYYLQRADSAQSMQHRIEKLTEQVETDPHDAMNWVDLGNTLREIGRMGRATEAYQVAASLSPQNLGLQINLANLIASSDRLEDAAARYRAILRMDPSLADVWLNLGVVYARQEQMDRAREAWEQAVRHDPGHEKAQTYLAKLDS